MTKQRKGGGGQRPKSAEESEKSESKLKGTWKENLGKYLIDISKYVITGVVIASLFQDVTDRTIIYVLGISIAIATLIVGLILTNKMKEDK